MAHLLIIENWVEGTGRLFPQAIHELGHTYTFVTRNRHHYLDEKTEKIHPIFKFASNVITAETNDIESLTHLLRSLHTVLKFDGVSTVCDYYIETVASVSKALELPQAFSSNVATERCKHKVRSALDDAGLANPKYFVAKNWEDASREAQRIGYPLIIKPTDLASSAYVTLVHNESELKQAFTTLGQFTRNFRDQPREPLWLLEEYMQGEEFSVEAVTFQGETTVIGITDKSLTGFPYFIEDGHMFPAKLPTEQANAIIEFSKKVLEAANHDHGISHTEIKLTANGPRLIEINPRPGGNYIAELIQHVTGIDFLNTHIQLALNQRPDLSGLNGTKGSAAVKFLTPTSTGLLKEITGQDKLDSNKHVLRWSLKECLSQTINKPIDNACYLGFVISRDTQGFSARDYAELAVNELSVTIESDNEVLL